MKNTIVIVLVGIAVIGSLIWFSKSDTGNQSANLNGNGGIGSIVSEETSFDFGEISMADGRVEHIFKLKNSGDGQVMLAKLYTSCMCTEAEFIAVNGSKGPFGMPGHGFVPSLNQTIEAGQDFEIRVIFDPAAHGPAGIGPVSRAVYLEQKNGEKLQLQIRGMVKP